MLDILPGGFATFHGEFIHRIVQDDRRTGDYIVGDSIFSGWNNQKSKLALGVGFGFGYQAGAVKQPDADIWHRLARRIHDGAFERAWNGRVYDFSCGAG